MAIKRLDTGTITATDTTYAGNIGYIRGKILKVEILNSASSDYWVYCDASVSNESLVDENIIGATGSKITVATGTIFYPRAGAVLAANTAVTNSFVPITVSGTIAVAVANIAAADTFRIVIWYDDMTD